MGLDLLANSRLKKFGIDLPFMIAPMVGISHVAFRELCRHYIPDGVSILQFTEMLSSRRLPSENIQRIHELRCSQDEKFWLPQLLANEERFIALSVEKLLTLNPWGIDINMGCPVKHTLKHNWGVRLMGDASYAADVVRITKKYSSVPVSVKLRILGDSEIDIQKTIDFTQALADAGADWLTIHARTPDQKHQGKAQWQLVHDIRQKLQIPVVLNGDIQRAEDIRFILDNFEVDGLMLARSTIYRPWLLWQFLWSVGYRVSPLAFERREPPSDVEAEGKEFLNSLNIYIKYLDQFYQDSTFKLDRLRFHVSMASKAYMFGHSLWRSLTRTKDFESAKAYLDAYTQNNISFPAMQRCLH